MRLLSPLHRWSLRNHHCVREVQVSGMERLKGIPPEDSALICPNHSYTGDGHVMMEVGLRSPRPFHIMAAWHVFTGHWGLDGWLLQRWGGFSVDREGCDRRAMKTAVELLSAGRFLVIFPEGEIYHLNERLTPLREGVAFLAATAQRDLAKSGSQARVWIVPAAIRYEFVEDVHPRLEIALSALEERVRIKPAAGMALHERIIRYGEVMLTIKEKEIVGRSREAEGDLPARIRGLVDEILGRLELSHLSRSNAHEPVPVRVKLLRQHLLDPWCGEDAAVEAIPQEVHGALEDIHLALQLYSYPGDYLRAKPSPERMAETIEKFEEDIYDTYARPKGPRRARVTFGEPIDVRSVQGRGRMRNAAQGLTKELESRLSSMVSV
jgi:1-acyl-sn-glycerol-3-phosphate acyltransferase